jgi:tRNA-specific 2-thiouridylase
MTKDEVRAHADRLGLRTAAKPDSQEVCFLPGGGRDRAAVVAATPGVVVEDGVEVGTVPALELLTVGQRRGLDLGGGRGPRYVLDVDVSSRTVEVGPLDALRTREVRIDSATWWDGERRGRVFVQTSAHGEAHLATYDDGLVRFDEPVRRVAPGQSVVLYDGDAVVGGGVATRMRRSPASASSASGRVGENSSRCTS